jgi:nitrite reductase/ring-hydroxylating ferredoxin subunit
MEPRWTKAASRAALEETGRRVVKIDAKQILLIAAEGRIFACNNRCPHEGYPLSDGTLGAGCALTCNWHNWKFDLLTSATLVGGDLLRTYPVELRGDEIWVDVADPPREAQAARALDNLSAAMEDDDYPRMAREIARLMKADADPLDALRHAVNARADHLEFGMTHAFAAAADWLRLFDAAPDEVRRLTALVEPVEHIAWDTLREKQFPYPTEKALWNAASFVAAVEAEDETASIALLRGALAAGFSYAELRPAFAEAALAHYADFGHAAIYTVKAGQLIDRLGPAVAEPVLLALTRQLVYATREERLPEFRSYGDALAAWTGKGDAPVSAANFYGLSTDAALARALASSGDVEGLFEALLGAASWSLLHFDLAVGTQSDKPVSHNVSWLDFTHALTFANAARSLCAERPDLWPKALLQIACFVGRNKPFIDAALDAGPWRVGDPDAFLARETAALYDHGVPEPLIACHRLKVLTALKDEIAARPGRPAEADMLAAVNRFLNSPLKRRHSLRHARQSLAFVAAEG